MHKLLAIKFHFCPIFRSLTKISIFAQTSIFDHSISFLPNISIFDQNFDFWTNFDFWPLNFIFAQYFDFWPKFRFLTIKFHFLPNISIFDQNFIFLPKFRFLTKKFIFYQNFDCWPKIWFLTNISILNQNFRTCLNYNFEETLEKWKIFVNTFNVENIVMPWNFTKMRAP